MVRDTWGAPGNVTVAAHAHRVQPSAGEAAETSLVHRARTCAPACVTFYAPVRMRGYAPPWYQL
nr:hypothetical protein StreXyl84_18480 [Streptomyces sp. Xyl84]